jgi:putative acetyltransferase
MVGGANTGPAARCGIVDRVDRLGRLRRSVAAGKETLRKRRGNGEETVMVEIVAGDLADPQVVHLLGIHLSAARAHTAPGSDHALDASGLQAPEISFWSAWEQGQLLAVGALKRLSTTHGEVKSMHTAEAARHRGIGSTMLRHIMDVARSSGMTRLSLETGSWDYFQPALALYKRHGFVACAPFDTYRPDRNSLFFTRDL